MRGRARTWINSSDTPEEIAAALLLYVRDEDKLGEVTDLINQHLARVLNCPVPKPRRNQHERMFDDIKVKEVKS